MGFLPTSLAHNPFMLWSLRTDCNGNFSSASTLQLSFIPIEDLCLFERGWVSLSLTHDN